MSNAILIDRFHCALCNVVRLLGDRYQYPWFRGVRVYGKQARAELVLGDYDDPDALRSTLDVALVDLAAAEPGETEIRVRNAFESLHEQWKAIGPRKAKLRQARATSRVAVADDEGGDE